MKRSMVAVAVAAVCAGAAAQVPSRPGVVIYGGVDGNVTRVNATGRGSIWQVRDGGMYVTKLGFTGMEDLGGGYRAGFVMESQSNSDTGTAVATNTTNSTSGNTAVTGLNWNRKVTVSLYSPYGEVRLGRDYTSTFVPTTYMDPFFSAGVSSAVNFQPFYTSTIALPTLVRASNMVGYYIPPHWVPGLYAYAQLAAGEGVGSRYEGLGSGYRRGPLLVSAAIARTKAPFLGNTVPAQVNALTAAADNNLHVWSLGASYDFSGFKLMGFYHSQTLDRFGSAATPGVVELDRQVDDWLLGFSWAIGVHTIKGAYMVKNDKGTANNDPEMIGLGYSYHFSKRTAVYANFVNIDNSANGTYNFLSSGFTPTAGGTGRALQVGISHNF